MDKSLLNKKILLEEVKLELIRRKRQELREQITYLKNYRDSLLEEKNKEKEDVYVKKLVLLKPFMGKMFPVS